MSSKTRIWVFHMKELIYTAIFGSMPAPEGDSAGEAADTATTAEPMDTTPMVIGAVVLAIAVGGVFGVKKLKERR